MQRQNKLDEVPQGFSTADIAQSDDDIEDLVFQRSILPERTGVFDLDFPESPKQSKNKGGKGKVKKSLPLKIDSNATSSKVASTATDIASKSTQEAEEDICRPR